MLGSFESFIMYFFQRQRFFIQLSCRVSEFPNLVHKVSLPFPFMFKCKPFLPRYLLLILSFSIHAISKLARCLLRFCMVSAALSSSLRNICADTMTLQSDRDFNIADFNRRMTSTKNPYWQRRLFQLLRLRTRVFLDDWQDKLTHVSSLSPGKVKT